MSSKVGKVRMVGRVAWVSLPGREYDTEVMVPGVPYTPTTLPRGAYMVRITAYMDGQPTPGGYMAVMQGVWPEAQCVGIARMLCEEVLQELT